MIDLDRLLTEKDMSKLDWVAFATMILLAVFLFVFPLYIGGHFNDELITRSMTDYTAPLFFIAALALIALTIAGRRALVRYKLFRAIWLFVCVWIPLNINSEYSELNKKFVYSYASNQYLKKVVVKSVSAQGTRGGPRYLLHVNPYGVSADAEINISKVTFDNLVNSSPLLLDASAETRLSSRCYVKLIIRQLGDSELVIGTLNKSDGSVLYRCVS